MSVTDHDMPAVPASEAAGETALADWAEQLVAQAVAALEAALERPGPGAAAPVDAIDDHCRSMARGSLAALWHDLREATASIDTSDVAPRRVRGRSL